MGTSNTLITIGLAALLLGLVLRHAPWLVNWFGRLPGDIRFQSGHSFVFIPITSMIVVSLLLTVTINLFFRK